MADRKIFPEHESEIISLYMDKGMTSRELGKKFSVDHNIILKVLRRNNVDTVIRRRKYYPEHDFFDIINTQAKAYILGLLYADGYVIEEQYTIGISLKESDTYLLENISKYLYEGEPSLYKRTTKLNGKLFNRSELRIYSEQMTQSLIKRGCVPRKSPILKFPEWLDRPLIPHFLRGVFDGDGCISDGNRGCKVHITSSHDFCQGLLLLLLKKEIQAYIIKKENFSVLRIDRQIDVKLFLDWLYQDMQPDLVLTRKYERYQYRLNLYSQTHHHFNAGSRWTVNEDYILKTNMQESLRELSQLIPTRTSNAIRARRKLLKDINIGELV